MSKVKNIQHLAFYAVAISSVLILFKIVTSYGQKIQAPPPIGGYYRLTAQNLPECFQSNQLGLTLQQSGIYLNGSLLVIKPNINNQTYPAVAEKLAVDKPSLNGHWRNQKITLSGSLPNLSSCPQKVNVSIEASVNKEIINGEINVNLTPKLIKFTALKENSKEQNLERKIH